MSRTRERDVPSEMVLISVSLNSFANHAYCRNAPIAP